ncbi:uncharacterized protein Z519_04141 [Cladophialophora bantiana CBS 173.52]|uniref:Uncharacterized protein n=1 Tax=Cladophialophora bantiana (strain ATCC 10958 / CBS 173.52 / CDC B-1940 / NIH 8579) TaxID=1442370 RepID=A0A0D2F057_CLAB1|nr:uncharacterized protein Z519_04141 [Cladophialophora bantiana CBS 173.52]KIW95556.1 hypothetical protein Z519_04141 [Cladophialophora bantiana CBS 173.52]
MEAASTTTPAGTVISNEQPYVDLPPQADGVDWLLQFTVSQKPTNCGWWATIDTPTYTSMLN